MKELYSNEIQETITKAIEKAVMTLKTQFPELSTMHVYNEIALNLHTSIESQLTKLSLAK